MLPVSVKMPLFWIVSTRVWTFQMTLLQLEQVSLAWRR